MTWIKDGGIIMYIICFFSVIGLYAILERGIYLFFKERENFSEISVNLKTLIDKNQIKDAIILLNKNNSSTAKVLKEVLKYGYKENKETVGALEEKAKSVALIQVKKLERNMWIMSVVAHTSPLLGLLGTVTGMIKAFQSVSIYGTGDPSVLARGISEALYTTAGGLLVAIPTMVIYNFYNKKIDSIIIDIETASTELLNQFRR